jgi:hypothetical protein
MPDLKYETAAGATAAMLVSLAVIAWGALAFGAVYPWAYWTLAAAAVASAACSIAVTRSAAAAPSSRGTTLSRPLMWALCAVGAAIAVQLMPLPAPLLTALSPRAAGILSELDPAFAAGNAHALSIWPASTRVALVLYAALVIWLASLVRLLSSAGSRRFVEALTGLGVLVALVGIVQKPLYSGAIYGVWTLKPWREPFGPFVNRNHFAGWMVMVLPLTLSLLVAGIHRSTAALKPGWRHKVLWLSSPEANRLALVAGAAMVMALSLVLTMSRSGMTAFVASIVMTGWFVARVFDSRPQRIGAGICLAAVVFVVVGWAGPDVIASRFSSADWGEFNSRRGAWLDAIGVTRAFPVAGTGANTYWAAALFYQRHELTHYFAQAHNDYLQIAAEGGLLLTLPALVCVVIFVRDVIRCMGDQRATTVWWLRAGAVTSLLAIAFQESVDFSLQMPGNAALFAAVCAIALHRPAPPDHRAPSSSLLGSLRLVPRKRESCR